MFALSGTDVTDSFANCKLNLLVEFVGEVPTDAVCTCNLNKNPNDILFWKMKSHLLIQKLIKEELFIRHTATNSPLNHSIYNYIRSSSFYLHSLGSSLAPNKQQFPFISDLTRIIRHTYLIYCCNKVFLINLHINLARLCSLLHTKLSCQN